MTGGVHVRRRDDVAPVRRWTRRRHRPSGDVAALRRPIYSSGRLYVAATLLAALVWLSAGHVPGVGDAVDAVDDAVLRRFRSHRVDVLDELAGHVRALGNEWTWRIVRWVTIVVGLGLRRFRHVAVFAGLLLVVSAIAGAAWQQGAPPMLDLGLAATGCLYVFVPRGRARNAAKAVVGGVLVPYAISRAYLGVDRPSALVAAALLGVAVPIVCFRYLVPNESFPITYGRRVERTLTPDQEQLIHERLAEQLGWEVRAIRARRPPGSSGSTPLVLELVAGHGGAPPGVFAKLYSLAHLRSDRWYKLARAIRYGRLEDESPFASVRQLVEHEDHLLRVAEAEGLPVPRSFGVVELRRGREYLLLIELLPEAEQLDGWRATVDLVDQGIALVDGLWSAGIAHRDIKPANLVVSRRRLHLVDLSFGEVAPSAWRQSVDLANMLLCLGLVAEPALVYERALRPFTAEEIGEAFAATAAVTIPAQLRRMLRERAPGLLEQLRSLAPVHTRIGIQRWSAARVALTIGTAATIGGAAALVLLNLETTGLL